LEEGGTEACPSERVWRYEMKVVGNRTQPGIGRERRGEAVGGDGNRDGKKGVMGWMSAGDEM
jgi:hypothetical protein